MMNLRYNILKYVILIGVTFYAGMSVADDLPFYAGVKANNPDKTSDPTANTPTEMLNTTVDRTWGLVLGDDVNVKVDLTGLEQKIDISSLPIEDKRYNTWLYLKTLDQTPTQLIFHYQVINVPLKNTVINTPRFDIKQTDGKWLTLPATSITIGPSLAITDGVENISIKPDMKPTLISTEDSVNRIKLFGFIAILSALILGIWHFGWKTKHRQPFAQAVYDLSRLKFHAVTPDQAARILHTAFNRTAGTIVVYGELDALLEQQPWLQPLHADIALFYTQSEQHFFARNSQQGPDIDAVRKLAKACRVKEMLA